MGNVHFRGAWSGCTHVRISMVSYDIYLTSSRWRHASVYKSIAVAGHWRCRQVQIAIKFVSLLISPRSRCSARMVPGSLECSDIRQHRHSAGGRSCAAEHESPSCPSLPTCRSYQRRVQRDLLLTPGASTSEYHFQHW